MIFRLFRALTLGLVALLLGQAELAADRPNILWITSEDNGPQLGCYGDAYAVTPNLDTLAARSLIYLNAWSTAPVCAPARTTLISGIYPPATGSQHMRSNTSLPAGFKMFPQYLRGAGYYCTNNSKEDYNLEKPGIVWDESSRKAHWKNRAAGQPFFAVFNSTISHESKIRNAIEPAARIHDPANAPIPAYHPDTREVRKDWAQYYDRMTQMDAICGRQLRELEEAGLADETIIFYYGDHGSGMPRSKRWPYNSGLHVPLIVYVPEKFKHLAPADYKPGGSSKRLVGFIDFPASVLSAAGIKPPAQFQGLAFMGAYKTPDPEYIYGFRGRMDERYDMVRTVRDGRYIYLRHYMPHKVYGQYIAYMFKTPTTRVWKDLFDRGKLNKQQSLFWQTKPSEELYDLQADPDEVNNLADSPAHQRIVNRLRKAQEDLCIKIRDVGFMPEYDLHAGSKGSTPYEVGHDDSRYPLRKIMNAAGRAANLKPAAVSGLIEAMGDDNSIVRYWAAIGMTIRGKTAVAQSRDRLIALLDDRSPPVQIAAAEALGRFGSKEDSATALAKLMSYANASKTDVFLVMQSLNAIHEMGLRAKPVIAHLKKLPIQQPRTTGRRGKNFNSYLRNLLTRILDNLNGDPSGSAVHQR